MIRGVAILATVACGRSQGVDDRELGGLVVAGNQAPPAIDVERATKDPAELGRALMLPERTVAGALGAHTVAIATTTTVSEAATQVSSLDDHVTLELGERGAFHATYTNSADYGREVISVGGKLYLRPRYQRWHARQPETPDEPDQLRDSFTEAIGATWELFAPGAELVDKGAAQVAGRTGRKIIVNLAASPRDPPAEPLVQRKWREHRTVDSLYGEVVLDADKGVPLDVRLQGTVGYTRDGRRFTMKLSLQSGVSGIGQAAAIAVPSGDDVVATPERLREVDDRDRLLEGIAPPSRKPPDSKGKP